jgi:hypothetical protein
MDEPLDLRDRAAADERSLGDLFSELSAEFSTLVRQEVELAKAELRQEAAKAGKAGGILGGAALAAYLSVLLLSFAIAWGLAAVMPAGFAFLIVGVVYGVVAAVLFQEGKSRVRRVRAVPEQTVETVKEDVQWAKAQLK